MKKILTTFVLIVVAQIVSAQNITICAGQSATLVTGNPTGLQNPTYSMNPGGITSTTGTYVVSPTVTTTYTLYATGNHTLFGMTTVTTTRQVNVSGSPTFSLTSPSNFTLGCSTKSAAVVCITNAQTTPTAGGSVSYTILSGGNSALPNGTLSNVACYTLTSPGPYTVVVRDNSNSCDTRALFSISSNTTAPVITSVSVPATVLNCTNTSVKLEAFSNDPNATFHWVTPQSTIVASSSVMANANTVSPTSTLTGPYTVVLTDNSSLCKTQQVVQVLQNLFPPTANIAAPNSSITCANPTVVLTNMSSTGIPNGAFPNGQPVVNHAWHGPVPQASLAFSTTYTASVPGVYTMQVTDLNNGCTSVATKMIIENREFVLIVPPQPFDICQSPTVVITPSILTNPAGLTFTWIAPPNAVVQGVNSKNAIVNAVGQYTLHVKNSNGCVSTEVFNVTLCSGIDERSFETAVSIFPNPGSGIYTISGEGLGAEFVVEIYDAKMSLIKRQRVSNGGTINITDQPAGIYLVKVGSGAVRIVKQ